VMGFAGTTIVEDSIAAGTGTDTLVLVGTLPNASVVINLSSSTDQYSVTGTSTAQTGFENVDATDARTGGVSTTVSITAATQGSQIAGSSQADSITGGVGNDSIYGAVGTDTVKAGAGTDTLYVIVNQTNTGLPFTRNTGDVAFTSDDDFTGVENIVISGNKSGTITLNLSGQTEAFSITSSIALGYRSDQTAADTPSTSIVAGAGSDTITGSSLADTIAGGAGADVISAGAGTNVLVFATGTNASGGSTASAFDTILGWASGVNTIDAGVVAIVADAGSGMTGVTVVSGRVTAGVTTLAGFITALGTSTTATPNSALVWSDGTDSYLFISDGVAGLASTDLLIKLTGVAATAMTINLGDITGFGG